MNMSDSERLGAGMTGLGLDLCDTPEDADVVVLNTCVVRQSAEDTATGMLGKLKRVKGQQSRSHDRCYGLYGRAIRFRPEASFSAS